MLLEINMWRWKHALLPKVIAFSQNLKFLRDFLKIACNTSRSINTSNPECKKQLISNHKFTRQKFSYEVFQFFISFRMRHRLTMLGENFFTDCNWLRHVTFRQRGPGKKVVWWFCKATCLKFQFSQWNW